MAENCIFYFSATGNSLWATRQIAQTWDDTAVFSMSGAIDSDSVRKARRIGFVFPVYVFGLPRVVADFLARCPIPADAYVFTLATYGSYAGMASSQAGSILAVRKRRVQYAEEILFPDNYIPFFPKPDAQTCRNRFEAAQKKIVRLCSVADDMGEERGRKNRLVTALLSVMHRFSMFWFPWSDYLFRVNRRCNSCGVCQKVCPVDNISLKNGRPRWHHRCEHCLACIHWCPQGAISIAGRRWQYHHPDISSTDIGQK
ncbi:MAG: EFR1 family ferrodoxin [Fibrobacterota bacterium]